jgi:hypothetical protein
MSTKTELECPKCGETDFFRTAEASVEVCTKTEVEVSTQKHWTAESLEAYRYAILMDFVSQLQENILGPNPTINEDEEDAGDFVERLAGLFNSNGNLTLSNLACLAKATGVDVAVVAYKNENAETNGPVNAAVFTKCWEALGRPIDFFSLDEKIIEVGLKK